ncbi:MAG: NUDIX domain-containing protein [Bacteroides sp.]|nr:NUDIX domain-containing protein [Bacteroides sp.]MCM1390731.1 NUDIX domain-containing protein [Bacteroides sp.]
MTIERSIYYSHLSQFFVAVDCVIFTVVDKRLKVLLVHRDFEPELGKWSLIGGFVGARESLDDAAARILFDLSGLSDVYVCQLRAFGEVDRDPGARVVSVAYYALINYQNIDHSVLERHNARWVDVDALPEMGFDHKDMIRESVAVIRKKIMSASLAFNMLPELFTLTQLQTLVETVTGKVLDKRNFRKCISVNEDIEPTDYIDKRTSKRGAVLYRYRRRENIN